MKREQDFSFCKQNNQNNSDHYDKSSALFETVPKRVSLKTLHTFNETSGRFPAVFVSTEQRYLNQNMTFY